jgi:hypothetical protein
MGVEPPRLALSRPKTIARHWLPGMGAGYLYQCVRRQFRHDCQFPGPAGRVENRYTASWWVVRRFKYNWDSERGWQPASDSQTNRQCPADALTNRQYWGGAATGTGSLRVQTSSTPPAFVLTGRFSAPRLVFGIANAKANTDPVTKTAANTIMASPGRPATLANPSRSLACSPGPISLLPPGLGHTDSSVPVSRESSPMT